MMLLDCKTPTESGGNHGHQHGEDRKPSLSGSQWFQTLYNSMSTEQNEIRLVDAVEYKIINAANDEAKLQEVLNTFLTPLLLKMNSEHAAVRAKVIRTYGKVQIFIKQPG